MSEVPNPTLEPNHAFCDSRRLTGPNWHFAGSATTLTPLGTAARDASAHAAWARRVSAVAQALGWPDPRAHARVSANEVLLLAAAPADQLMTATEVSEWAWERAAAEAHALQGFDVEHAVGDSLDDAATHFAARAAAERRPAMAALRATALARGLPIFADDDNVSIGAGHGSRTWPLHACPNPEQLPWDELHDVPTALVTGSNGKTTTVRLIAAMLRAAGLVPGLSSTTGLQVGSAVVEDGDFAGPAGARAVLRHRQVQAAVLETARGGILRRGLAVARADVAVVTNISADHFGEYGVDSLDDLAEVKLVVARALVGAGQTQQRSGLLVLNADDAVLMQAASRLAHTAVANKALFAADHASLALYKHRGAGGATCAVRHGVLTLAVGQTLHPLGHVEALPLAHGGAARHNVANLAAAALAAWRLQVPIEAIAHVAQTFGQNPADNPGRLERWAYGQATVLIDYAHNPDGLAQLLTVARALQPSRLSILLGQAGNRSNEAIAELGRTAARFAPDEVLLKDMGATYLRGRALGEVPALLRAALIAGGVANGRIHDHSDEEAAARRLLEHSQPGEVVVLPLHDGEVRSRVSAWLRDRQSQCAPASGA